MPWRMPVEMTEVCVVFLAQLSSIAFAKLRAHAETGIPRRGVCCVIAKCGWVPSWRGSSIGLFTLPFPDPLGLAGHFLWPHGGTRFCPPFSLGMFGRSGVQHARAAAACSRHHRDWCKLLRETRKSRPSGCGPRIHLWAKIGTDSGEAETTPRVSCRGIDTVPPFSGWQGDGRASQRPQDS